MAAYFKTSQSDSSYFVTAVGYHPSDDYSATISFRTHYFIKNGNTSPNRVAFYKQHGYMPITAYTAEYQRTTCSLGSSTVSVPEVGGGTLTRNVVDTYNCFKNGAPPSLSHTDVLTAQNNSVKNLNSKLRSQTVSLGETIAEGHKTRKMIISSATSLVTALGQIRKGNFVAAAKTLKLSSVPQGASRKKSLSSNWLAYRYGWMPLFLTVYGSMQWYYNIGKTRQPVMHISGTSQFKWSEPTTESLGGVGYGNSSGTTIVHFQYKNVRKIAISGRVETGVYYRISNPTVRNATGLGLTNPLLVAWELVPLSFVADWFVNVSDVLENLDAWTGAEFIVGYQSTRATSTSTVESSATNADIFPYTLLGYNPPKCVSETTSFARTVLTSPPTVSLQLQAELTPKRFIDAIALVVQRFK